MIDTLKLILSHDEVREYVSNNTNQSDDGFIRNYEDGSHFKSHPFFKKYPHALRIQLYYDDFLGNNALGTKTADQKVGAFYFSILNLPPHLNYYLGNVHVLALCHRKYITDYSINQILNSIIDEIVLLESDLGVPLDLKSGTYTIRGTIVTFTGDSLALNEALGFLAPSANCFCRLCMITRNQLLKCTYFKADSRNSISLKKQLQQMSASENGSTETGLKIRSNMNNSKYYDLYDNYIFDILHDLWEGWAPYIVKLVTSYLVSNKNIDIDVDTLNYRLNIFDYGKTESQEKPTDSFNASDLKNSSKHKLKQRGSQNWCLLRVFPFLIFDKVDHNDPYFKYLLNFIELTQIFCSPKWHPSIFDYTEDLIEYEYDQFKILFPKENRINKIHHPGHYIEAVKKFGPLSNYATYKYEAKHQLHQNYAKICHNFMNITLSMSHVAQISQCKTWGVECDSVREKLVFEKQAPQTSVKNSVFAATLIETGANPNDLFTTANRIQIYGTNYERGNFLVLESGKNERDKLPLFGQIQDIIIIKDKVLFYCKEWPSEYLEVALNSYNVKESSRFCIIDFEDLIDSKPYSLWKTFASNVLQYISLKHKLY